MKLVIYEKAVEARLRIQAKFRSRVLEWEHAVMITLFGFVVVTNPNIFDGPSYKSFAGGPELWGPMSLIGGFTMVAALCVNGYMARSTAVVRAVGTLASISLFLGITWSFVVAGTFSTALSMYPVAGIFSFFALYWAVIDVGDPGTHDDELE